MPRETRLAARPHGGDPTYSNVTEQFLFTKCKQRVGVQVGNAEKGLLRSCHIMSGQHDVTTKSITTAMLVTALFFGN